MSKHKYSSRYVLKINSSRLKMNNWNLDITIQQARDNEELISLGDSQILRFIRDIKGINYTEDEILKIKDEIKSLKKEENSKENIEKIKELYTELDDILYIKDYVGIVFDNKGDFDRATGKGGFTINSKKYKRIVGSTGGIKNNTVMFCCVDIYEELNNRLENDRNKTVPLVPAKFEAYKALATSVSQPVPEPKGVLVIKDGCVKIKDRVIKVSDNGDGGFKVEHNVEYEADKEFADGSGMIRKELAEKWAIELGLTRINKEGDIVADYIPSGFNTRYSFEKGMLGVFEFEEFGDEIAGTYIVEDVWGNEIDVRDVDIVLTTNMLKLWNAYDSIDDYLSKSKKNGYLWSVTKVCPKVLEESRNTNYQYLQSYEDMSDEDIEKLITPTVNDINGALGDNVMKTILFTRGIHINRRNITKSDYDYSRALMIDKRMIEDPYVKMNVYRAIEKRIKESKKGVLRFEGNYSIIMGDLYALCQSMYGLKITGLLDNGEFYSKHWTDKGVFEVIAFRSPMTSHNNIKRMNLIRNKEVDRWFKYLRTVVIFNAWDTTTDAMNGADFDSDSIITTDNDVLIRNTKDKLAIVCEQKSVPKELITEGKLKKSNKNGFGDAIGTITNRVTTMFDVLASLDKDSLEYKELSDRIIQGQAYQQESIDKIKGIEAKEMPKEWYDYKVNKILEEDGEEAKNLKNRNIKMMVNKKPYFFIYNYDNVRSKYNSFIKNINNNCVIRYGMTLDKLKSKENKTEEEIKFIKGTVYKSPVFNNPCVMNKICWRLEKEYEGIKLKLNKGNFDYSILKTDKEYNEKTYERIEKLYEDYKTSTKQYSQTITAKTTSQDKNLKRHTFIDNFRIKADGICSNEEELCNIVIDLTYKKANDNKQFAWDICGEQIIKNLLSKNNYTYKFPVKCNDGDIEWNGNMYKIETLVEKEI